MEPDQNVCLCFKVSQRKIVNYLQRERPTVPSQLTECLGAGTGCGWCVPSLEKLWEQVRDEREPGLDIDSETYAAQRREYCKTGDRPGEEPAG